MSDAREWRDGDVFRWCYRDPCFDGGRDPYWCCSRIAKVTAHGVLVDTYWNSGSGRRFTREDADENLELRFVANLGDLVEVRGARERYHPDDLVDLSHPNSFGGVYVRKGAKECLQTQLELAEAEAGRAERELQFRRDRVDWLRGRIADEAES